MRMTMMFEWVLRGPYTTLPMRLRANTGGSLSYRHVRINRFQTKTMIT
jgi:hypothetical protein